MDLPAPTPNPRTGRRRPLVSRPFLWVMACSSVLFVLAVQHSAESIVQAMEQRLLPTPGRNTIAEREESGPEAKLHEEVRRLALGIDRAARGKSLVPKLAPIEDGKIELPQAMVLYRDEVERYATAPFADAAQALEMEKLGHGMAVAAVAWLQDRDFAVREQCAAGARVMEWLERVSGVEGLVVEEPLAEPDAAVVRRFTAAAVAWRRLMERQGRDETVWRRLLELTGKAKARAD